MQFFYEAQPGLYVLLALTELALIAGWLYRRRRNLQRSRLLLLAFLVPPLLAALLVALDRSVVTEGEKLEAAVREIAADFSRGRTTALEKWLDKDFDGMYAHKEMNRAETIAHARATLQTYVIGAVKVNSQSVHVKGDKAVHHVRSTVTSSYEKKDYTVKWKLRWVKRREGWRIIWASDPEELNTFY